MNTMAIVHFDRPNFILVHVDRASHQVVDLGWVDLELGVLTFAQLPSRF